MKEEEIARTDRRDTVDPLLDFDQLKLIYRQGVSSYNASLKQSKKEDEALSIAVTALEGST